MVKQSIKSIATAVIAATLFMAGATLGRAQNYPVQANAMLMPPYSLKLSDYAAPEGNRMRITLLLKDALQPSLDVRLRLVIEGNGVRLATKPAFNPQPITLLSNSLYEVNYDELSEYFLPQNLTAEGITMSALTASGRLPEGLYKFKVEALEAHRDVPVSITAVAIGWLMLNDPPQWLSPRTGQKLTAGMPQGIQLSWTRCGMSSPNAALSTQYEVTLVEMTQPGMDPNVAITVLQPLYQDVSPTENLFYGPDKPELIPGNTYAVRVRAFDTRGYDLYRNGGLSPVTTFRYGEPCHAPVFLQADKVAEQSADLSWNTPPQATGYFVRYRENGADLSDWYDDQATEATFNLKNLKPDHTYEYQVQSVCGTLPSDYSAPATLKTKKLENRNQSCAEKATTANMPANKEPLPLLRVDETFFAGVMPVKVTSVKGGSGTFSGTGDVYLPIVGVALTCSFKDVGINTDYQLISGEVVTTRSFNGTLFGEGGDQEVKDTVHLTNPIDTIITSPGGDVTIIAGNDTIRIPIADQPVVIYPPGTGGSGTVTPGTTSGGGAGSTGTTTGEGGGGPLIVEGGTVKPYNPQTVDPNLPTAFFRKAANMVYGYDSLAYPALSTYYPVATVHGKEVDIPYKALALNQQDNIELEFSSGSTALTLDSLTFDVPGSALKVRTLKLNSKRMRVTLQGVSEGSDPLAATYTRRDADGNPEQVDIGVAQLVTYQPQTMKLVVVPLKGTQVPNKATLAKELTDIYGQAVCSWSVDVVEPFTYTLPTEGLKYGSSETMSSYTAEMNALIDAYKTANPSLPEDTYFLFVVPAITDGVNGYMPRARRFGFVSTSDARTITHELGHGAFNLSHTFPVLPRATTDNLMDYNEGSRLIKPQWDLIHNPELTTGLLDDESDGASVSNFKATFDKEKYNTYGSLQDPRSEIPIITIKYSLSDTLGYKIMLVDKKEVKAIFQKQIYPIATTVKYLYEIPGNKTISVVLVDKNFTPIDSSIISTTIIDSSTVAVIDGDQKIGPLDIKFDTPKTETRNGDTLICVVSKCSFTLQVNEFEFATKKFNITNASLVYKKIKKTNVIVGAQVVWDNSEGMDVGEVGFMSSKVTHVGVSVDDQGKLKGEIKFKTSLSDDYSYKDFLLIKKGLDGQFSFNYSNDNKTFLGNFNFEGLNNINMSLTKDATTRKPFAELTGGTVSKEGVLSGTFKGIENSSYKSNGFTITVNKLELVGDYNLKTGVFKPKSGEGNLTVSKIKGTKGKLLFDVKFGDVITVALDKSKSDLVIAGLVAKDLDLTAVFTDNFEFQDANGSLKLVHANYGTDLNVPSFEISAGEVKTLQITGNLSYKGFVFELEKCDYSSDKGFVLSGMVKLGSDNKFLAQNITIDTSGTFRCSNISGEMGIKYVNASFSAGISNTGVSGSFTAKMFGLDLKGGVNYGIASKKSTDLNYAVEKQYSYGQFSIVTSTVIPVFPGLKISKLGGMFGFNCSYDLTKHPMKLNSCYQSYVAGLSLGIGDMAGIFNFVVDPALVQFSNTNASIFINSTLSIPASKPMFIGRAELLLQYPSGNISGKVSASVSIPNNNGWILKTVGENQVNFLKDEGQTRIYTTSNGFHAEILNSLDLTGSIDYIKNYNESGSVTSTSGEIKGNISYNFYEGVHLSYLLDAVRIDGSLKIDFNANMSMNFDDNGSSGTFSGNLIIVPKAQIAIVGGTFGAEGYFKGAANVSYTNTAANLKAAYVIDLKCYAGNRSISYSTSGAIDKTITR